MVLDQIDDKRVQLLEAFKVNHTVTAREILTGIYEIEHAVRSSIDLGESEWGHRLEKIMGSVRAAVDSEVQTIAVDHLHLRHVLQSADRRPRHSWTERLGRMIWKGQAALVMLTSGKPPTRAAAACRGYSWAVFNPPHSAQIAPRHRTAPMRPPFRPHPTTILRVGPG
jgi:hypothetical protein